MTHPRFPPPPRRLPTPAPPPRRCWSSPGSSCPSRLLFARRTCGVLPSFRFLSLPPLLRCCCRPCSLAPLTTAGTVALVSRLTAAAVTILVAVASAVAAYYLPSSPLPALLAAAPSARRSLAPSSLAHCPSFAPTRLFCRRCSRPCPPRRHVNRPSMCRKQAACTHVRYCVPVGL